MPISALEFQMMQQRTAAARRGKLMPISEQISLNNSTKSHLHGQADACERESELHRQKTEHENNRPAQSPKPEPAVRDEPVGTERGESPYPERIHVRVTSFRRRLCDPDNLCPKYFVDCLRYAGLIDDDTSRHIELTVLQEQVCRPENERTEIEIGSVDS